MFLAQRTVTMPKTAALQFLKLKSNESLSPISCNITSNWKNSSFQQNHSQVQLNRLLHVTHVNRDLEAGLRALGAGIAATGVIGSGIGLGIIFGNLLSATARNPSIANQAFTNAIMGAAFCESLGLFAMVIAFVVMG